MRELLDENGVPYFFGNATYKKASINATIKYDATDYYMGKVYYHLVISIIEPMIWGGISESEFGEFLSSLNRTIVLPGFYIQGDDNITIILKLPIPSQPVNQYIEIKGKPVRTRPYLSRPVKR